jgi:hypothetical protein
MVESTHSALPEPDNGEALDYMRQQIEDKSPMRVIPDDGPRSVQYDDLDLGGHPWGDG